MHNFYGVRTKVNTFRKGFLLDPYDQPTYLTFALDFRFEESPQTDGVYTGDDMLWSSPLFAKGGKTRTNSAQTYLGSTGHKDKEEALVKFKSILEYLTFNAPWYFQSIQGLSKLWSNATDITGAYKGNEAVLAINTLESIDLRITELANLYRSAIYDKVYMRERVPDNLRWFAMDVYIAEARNIRYQPAGQFSNMTSALGINTSGINRVATGLTAGLGALAGNDELDQSNPIKQFGFVKFKCRQCEFDFSESFAGGDTMNIDTSKLTGPNENSFKINVGYFEEESGYQDGGKLYDNEIQNSLRNPWSARNTAANVQNRVEGASMLPGVGGFVDQGIDAVQENLQRIGGLINPVLGAAFSRPNTKPIGDLYENNNPSKLSEDQLREIKRNQTNILNANQRNGNLGKIY